jgi:hypothetical protein
MKAVDFIIPELKTTIWIFYLFFWNKMEGNEMAEIKPLGMAGN